MNFCLFLVVIFSTSVFAGFKEDHKKDIDYCMNLTKDSNKVEMVNEKWTLTKKYLDELDKNQDLLKSQMFCDVALVFNKNFEKNHQPKFEVLAKKRLNIVEVEAIKVEVLSLVYDDKPKARLDAFRGKWPGIQKYYEEKIRLVLAARLKSPTKK